MRVHVSENHTWLIVCCFFIYEQAVTVEPELASNLPLHRVNRWLICSVWHVFIQPACCSVSVQTFSLSSNLATQIKGQKNKPKKKSSFSVFDDESTHPLMHCSLNIAFNHAISNCGIHSDYIFHNENIYFVSVLIGARLTQYVSM